MLDDALRKLDDAEMSLDGRKWYSVGQLRQAFPESWLTQPATIRGNTLGHKMGPRGELWRIRWPDNPRFSPTLGR